MKDTPIKVNKGVKSKAPVKAGKEKGVKVPRIVKDSDQLSYDVDAQ